MSSIDCKELIALPGDQPLADRCSVPRCEPQSLGRHGVGNHTEPVRTGLDPEPVNPHRPDVHRTGAGHLKKEVHLNNAIGEEDRRCLGDGCPRDSRRSPYAPPVQAVLQDGAPVLHSADVEHLPSAGTYRQQVLAAPVAPGAVVVERRHDGDQPRIIRVEAQGLRNRPGWRPEGPPSRPPGTASAEVSIGRQFLEGEDVIALPSSRAHSYAGAAARR
jgi:hypothetical protein